MMCRERGHALWRVTLAVMISAGALIVQVADAMQSAAVGLVIEVGGSIEPGTRPGSDIMDGMELHLARNTTLTFVHYATCQAVTMTGGTLRLRDGRYQIEEAQQVKEAQVTCAAAPLIPVSARTSTGAGLTLRSFAGALPRVGHRPTIVVSGAQAAHVSHLVVHEGEHVVAQLRLSHRQAVWSPSEAPLAEGRTYLFQFVRRDGTSIEYRVRVHPAAGSDASALALFRVE